MGVSSEAIGPGSAADSAQETGVGQVNITPPGMLRSYLIEDSWVKSGIQK
jgi:hypothetical protein